MSAQSAVLELSDGGKVSLSLPLRSTNPFTDSPVKRRSSAAAAATATLGSEGLEHELTLPAGVGGGGASKKSEHWSSF